MLLALARSVGHPVASAQSCTGVFVHNPQCFEVELHRYLLQLL